MDDQAHRGKAYQDAIAASTKRRDELTSASVANTQHVIFQFDPKLSFMPKDFTSVDPEFWTPKPKPAPATTMPAAQDKPKPKSE